MQIKNKLAYSIGSLLIVIILLGILSARNINRMKRDTENILANNYNSVKYAQQMQSALNIFYKDSTSLKIFIESLRLQQENITEPYEKEVTVKLIEQFRVFEKHPNRENFHSLSEVLNSIVLLNISAISHKAEIANATANRALIWIIVFAVLSAVVATIMLIRFPKSFTRPIKELIDGIVGVSNHNYENRLNFSSTSEFGKVAVSFNSIATKRYLEIIINSIEEPIIGIDSNKMVLFVNNAAVSILNLPVDKMINKSALDISLNNDLFRRLIRGLEQNEKNSEPLKIYSNNKESYFEVRYILPADNIGNVILLHNITKFKELDNAKTNFISIISHELKTPIAAIMMSLKLLEDKRVGEMNEEQSALSKSIKDNSDRLLSITGELLKMTQTETGALQLSPKVTKPIELINYAL
ncbi:MAG: histidine kinase dimerization/phospho-acceptor domain-containing protein, partial [Bacteroidales bacterium]